MNSFLSILALSSAGTGIVLMWILLRRFFSVPVTLIAFLLPVIGPNVFRRFMQVKEIGFNPAFFIEVRSVARLMLSPLIFMNPMKDDR
jgi:hypothetical protein